MRRILFFLIIGLGGAAILVWLGAWQVQRLAWKNSVIADINARIKAEAVAVPSQLDPAKHAYLPVTVTGILGDQDLRVLVSQKDIGAGYRIITSLQTAQGAVMVDRGFVSVNDGETQTPTSMITVTGNLQWPQETDGFTPEPDLENNIWFARDVPVMAQSLGTKPILIVATQMSQDDTALTPLPVDTSRIPNDHLQYAITWFSLAAIWLAMTTYFLRRRAPSES